MWKEESGCKAVQRKEEYKHPSTEGATMEGWFKDIGLGDEPAMEDPTTKGPPSIKKKKKTRSEMRTIYKYPMLESFMTPYNFPTRSRRCLNFYSLG